MTEQSEQDSEAQDEAITQDEVAVDDAAIEGEQQPGQEASQDDDAPVEPQPLEHVRMVEALLFAAAEPLDMKSLTSRLPDGVDAPAILAQLKKEYEPRGVSLEIFGGKWAFRTASDLAWLMEREKEDQRRLSRAAVETLAIVAYHQPVTRAEIEEIRGVAVSKGTIDVLLETGWIKPRGRRRTPGRPVTYGITDEFLQHFGLENRGDLPGLDELKAAGLLDSRLPSDFSLEPGTQSEPEDPLEDDGADGDVSDMIAGTLDHDDDETGQAEAETETEKRQD